MVFLIVLIAIIPSLLGQATAHPKGKGGRRQLIQCLFFGESILRMI
ncbi:hypothetical protein N0824_01106 [Microcystis sp. 0824]|nr:hypothetical protein N0824_01106 [Microcystis sp. 0824]